MSDDRALLREFMAQSVQAARLAGERIMSHYGKDLDVFSKGIGTHTGDCVTQADHEAQDVIFDHLFHRQYQDRLLDYCAVLSEEMADHEQSKRFEKDYTFLIDPMDGTRGFLDHNNSFGVSIGLIRQDHLPVFGVVFLPAFNKMFTGMYGEEAHMNGRRLQPASADSDTLTLFVSEAEIFPAENNARWHHICAEIKARCAIKHIRPSVIGSPVHKGCLTAESDSPALYLGLPRSEKGVSLWDMAATAAIVSGAGGHVSDVFGHPLELNRKESTYVHHKGFLYCNCGDIAKATLAAIATL